MKKAKLASFCAVFFISACGGSGGDGGEQVTTNPTVTADGYWKFPEDGGLLITPQGQVYGIESSDGAWSAYIGSASLTGSQLAISGKVFSTDPAAAFSINGTVVDKSSIAGTATVSTTPPVTGAVSLKYDKNYEASTTVGFIGGYEYKLAGNAVLYTGTMKISLSGDVTGLDAGCDFSGRLTQQDAGKNFYRLSVTFSTNNKCKYPGQEMQGVVVPMADKTYGAVLTSVDGNKAQAFVFDRP